MAPLERLESRQRRLTGCYEPYGPAGKAGQSALTFHAMTLVESELGPVTPTCLRMSYKLARVVLQTTRSRSMLQQPARFISTHLKLRASEKVPAPGTEAEPLPDAAVQPAASMMPDTDWSSSFSGLSEAPFKKQVAEVLMAPLDHNDIEIKPDGILYLPEIKYRRVLNRAFGPGGWGLAPRSDTRVEGKQVSREYALVCLGRCARLKERSSLSHSGVRLVGVARGEQDFFDPSGIATATEGCKSNALMRCCKDLGIGSELWCVFCSNQQLDLTFCAGTHASSANSKKSTQFRSLLPMRATIRSKSS
jgi:hypothetical protein